MDPVELGTFSEDLIASDVMFTDLDAREFLYSDNYYNPTSSESPIVWEDEDAEYDDLPDIVDKGDRVLNSTVAKIIMSFDPFGVEIYPAQLNINDNEVKQRYLMSVKNVIDVLDYDKSSIEPSPIPGDDELLIGSLYISSKKLSQIPLYKRLIFRVKGADDTIYFDGSIIDAADEYFSVNGANGIQITPFNTSEKAPIL